MNGWIEDLRAARRALLRRPGMTLAALLTLALGIGANTVIFTAVEGVLLNPLPYRDADRMVYLQLKYQQGSNEFKVSPFATYFRAWRDQAGSLEELAAFKSRRVLLDRDQLETDEVFAVHISPRFFSFLGVTPALGRDFADDEARAGDDRVVVLSDGLWKGRYGADPGILGRVIAVDDEPATVVGVLPPRAARLFPVRDIDIWLPLVVKPVVEGQDGEALQLIGRLRQGVSAAAAQAELTVIAQGQEESGQLMEGLTVKVAVPADSFEESLPQVILLFQIAVGFVLLIACGNVAHLLLAQGESRRRELAMRTVLGADRRRLLRQLLTESLVLSSLGGLLALLLAAWGLDALFSILPTGLEHLALLELNPVILAFTTLVSLLTGLAFGLLPAVQGSLPDLDAALKQCSSNAGASRRRGLVRQGLVTLEVAVAFVLLVGAGLLITSIGRLLVTNTAFEAEKLLIAELEINSELDRHQLGDLTEQILRGTGDGQLGESVALANNMPPGMGGVVFGEMEAEGRFYEGEIPTSILFHTVVTPGYFRTLGIRLLDGRDFTRTDGPNAEPVLIVSQSLASLYWPGESAVGRRLRFDTDGPWHRVIGVAADVRQTGLASAEDRAQIYQPFQQSHGGSISLAIRARGNPLALVETLKAQIAGVAPGVKIGEISTMEHRLWNSIQSERFRTLLMTLFAAMATLLTLIGIYGVVAYSVSERTREIGIRMALGAGGANVVTQMIRRSMMPVLLGVGAGIAGALGLSRLFVGVVHDVSVHDPGIFTGAAVLLVMITFFATWLSVRRAAVLEPVVALRHD